MDRDGRRGREGRGGGGGESGDDPSLPCKISRMTVGGESVSGGGGISGRIRQSASSFPECVSEPGAIKELVGLRRSGGKCVDRQRGGRTAHASRGHDKSKSCNHKNCL